MPRFTLSAWEEESLEDVQRDHSTRSSGVGSDHVISTCVIVVLGNGGVSHGGGTIGSGLVSKLKGGRMGATP